MGFIQPNYSQDGSPEEVQRRRRIAEALITEARNAPPSKHWLQSVANFASNVVGNSLMSGADADARRGRESSRLRLLDALGGSAEPSSPPPNARRGNLAAALMGSPLSGESAPGASQLSGPSPAVRPAVEAASEGGTNGWGTTPTGGDWSASPVYNEFIGGVREGGLTNPYGLAAVTSTGRAESGFSPSNANRTWSDPSESGEAGTAGGIMSWRGPRLEKLQSFAASRGEQPGAISPRTQAEFFLSEDPALVQRLQAAESPEEAQQLINQAWRFAGYDRPGGESDRRMAYAQEALPTFQGSPDGAASEGAPVRFAGPGAMLPTQTRAAPSGVPMPVSGPVGAGSNSLAGSRAPTLPAAQAVDSRKLYQLLSDPWSSPQDREVVMYELKRREETARRSEDRSIREQEFQANQQYRRDALDATRENRDAQIEARRDALDVARQNRIPAGYREGANGLEVIPGGPADPNVIRAAEEARAAAKPKRAVPAAVQSAEASDLEDVQSLGGVNDMLSRFDKQIEDGKLDLGFLSNLASGAQNFLGMSDEESRNYASFQAGLEKLRNDSLRLNKGVQTEGDSQRAWNELLANINDPEVVRQRIAEIQDINKKAVQFKYGLIDNRRAMNGLDALDASSIISTGRGGAGAVREGATATNQQTGERMEFRNGQWVPL